MANFNSKRIYLAIFSPQWYLSGPPHHDKGWNKLLVIADVPLEPDSSVRDLDGRFTFELVLVEIQRIRDGGPPVPVVEHKLVAEAHWY